MSLATLMRRAVIGTMLALAAVMLAAGGCQKPGQATKAPAAETAKGPAVETEGWMSLFDGKTLKNWKVTDFGGEGAVTVKDGQLLFDLGAGPLTGVTWTGAKLPTMNYEATLEAMRVDGSDFFCALTFPVRDSACSFVCGGWGGTLVGISSVDGFDASENETSKFKEFQSGRWYRIHVRVTEKKIEAWIDDDKFVDLEPGERKIDVRLEVEGSKPFGMSAFRTKAALRDIRVRPITE